MTRLIVDHATRAKLCDLARELELCDEFGQILGHFTPAHTSPMYHGVDAPATEDELQQAERESGRPLSDILRDLAGQR